MQLYVRQLDTFQSRPVPGAEGAAFPFFSPDGQWVGFFADEKLKKVSISGGAPSTLCDAGLFGAARGASWGANDTIVFSQAGSGMFMVPATGGTPEKLNIVDAVPRGFANPHYLPGGEAFLFTGSGEAGDRKIGVHSLERGESKILLSGTRVQYVPTGHLIYSQAETPRTLLAVRFDPSRLEVTGAPSPVVEGVVSGQFATSDNGMFIYLPGGSEERNFSLVWVDREGNREPLAALPNAYRRPRVSPDGQRLALTVMEAKADIWLYEIARNTLTKLTFEGFNQQPLWTPDGKRVLWRSRRGGDAGNLYWKLADGSGTAERLTTSEFRQNPGSFSPDGKTLAFQQYLEGSETSRDIWVLPLTGAREASPLLQTRFNESGPLISPDGHWMAYVSDESGRSEIYVQSFPARDGKWQISREGGVEPLWAPNGRELFFRNEIGNRMMIVDMSTDNGFAAGSPRLLFEGSYQRGSGAGVAQYDISPDGERFLMIQPHQAASQINLVLNWFEELKRLVPTD
jgi:serine/threonine-protein kinase